MARSGIDTSALDPAIRPQDDLYQHVNGRWIAQHEIPADRAMDGAFRALHDRAEEHVREIVEDAAAQAAGTGSASNPEATDGPDGTDGASSANGTVEAQIGALYTSFMDTETVQRLGTTPLAPDLGLIANAS